jgi:hypothetical protein
MVTAGMAGRGSAAFLAWYWSLRDLVGWRLGYRLIGHLAEISSYGTRASGLAVLVIKRLGMIRHLIERPAGW